MRHRVAGRRLGRSPSHRKRLRQNLALQILKHGRITTTVEKAKEVRPYVEKLITLAREKTVFNVRRGVALLGNHQEAKDVARHLFDNVAPSFKDRPGGYTRILRLSNRRLGDGGHQAIIELVNYVPAAATTEE